MTPEEQKSILTIALLAAFCDGDNNDAERAEIKRIADSLSQNGELNAAAIYQDVIMNRSSIERAASGLGAPESRKLAYELAVGVCNADGAQSVAERAFLAALRSTLGLGNTENVATGADALATASLSRTSSFEPTTLTSNMSVEEQDKAILHYAVLNGALELLPDSLASMAIIPLQMKMVYRIGKWYGFELDRGHIKDFLATAGVGLASQYVEQIGAKLVGRLFGGGLIGGLLGGVAKQSVSSGMSFATTYALGHLARRYYAGGRTFSTAVLKDTYEELLGQARGMQGQYLPAIRAQAQTINVGKILEEVR